MEAKAKLNLLLKERNAVLVSKKNHLKYHIPNPNGGQLIWIVPNTPSDYHAYDKNYSDLKRALRAMDGITPVNLASETGEPLVATTHQITLPPPPAPPQAAPEPEPTPTSAAAALELPEPVPAAPVSPDRELMERTEQQIAAEQARYDNLFAEMQLSEKRLEVLKGILKFAAEFPQTEAVLKSVIPAPPAPTSTIREAAPVHKLDKPYIAVTRTIVSDTLALLPSKFTIGDVLAHICGDVVLDGPERASKRQSIRACLHVLRNEGLIEVTDETNPGLQGKAEQIWHKLPAMAVVAAKVNGVHPVGRS